jgi:hypothetical protein
VGFRFGVRLMFLFNLRLGWGRNAEREKEEGGVSLVDYVGGMWLG